MSRSLDDLNEDEEIKGIFLTETQSSNYDKKSKLTSQSLTTMSKLSYNSKSEKKENEAQTWDYHLLDLLSEPTARWLAMKHTTDRILNILNSYFDIFIIIFISCIC
jgi:hypothetical protein